MAEERNVGHQSQGFPQDRRDPYHIRPYRVGRSRQRHARNANTGAFVFPAPVYRTLGKPGLKITVVSFGAMLTPESEVMRVAFDHGINYVDTARRYMGGNNEEIVGKALKGIRDKIYLATKITPAAKTKKEIYQGCRDEPQGVWDGLC